MSQVADSGISEVISSSAARSLISCVVADDHPALVQAVSALLTENTIQVVGQANNGVDALAAIAAKRPTVAILDLSMPPISGIEVARRASRLFPETASILYTGSAEQERLVEALDAGARGFVLKRGPLEELVRAVRMTAGGDIYVDPELASTLVRAGVTATTPELSRREREILRLLADGRSNQEIAETLFISAHTVRTYIGRAMQKLEADTRTHAVAIAIRRSLIG